MTLAHVASLTIAGLMAVVSAAGLAFGSLYAADAVPALGVTASAAGVLVPGLRAHDAFNLLVGLPLYYVRYTYVIYLGGAPFGPLFLAYVAADARPYAL